MPDLKKHSITYTFKPRIAIRGIFIILPPVLVVYIIALLLMRFIPAAGIIILLINSMILIILSLQICAIGTIYRIDNNGIFAQRMYLKKYFPFDDILNVQAVDQQYIENNLRHWNQPGCETHNITEDFFSIFEMEDAVQFSSVSIPINNSGSYIQARLMRGSGSSDRFILVTMKNGNPYILTPWKEKLFLDAYSRLQTSRLHQS